MEFVLGSFSCFFIEISYSNSTFYMASCSVFWCTTKFQQNEHISVINVKQGFQIIFCIKSSAWRCAWKFMGLRTSYITVTFSYRFLKLMNVTWLMGFFTNHWFDIHWKEWRFRYIYFIDFYRLRTLHTVEKTQKHCKNTHLYTNTIFHWHRRFREHTFYPVVFKHVSHILKFSLIVFTEFSNKYLSLQ